MKEIVEEYKKEIKELLNSRIYVFSVLLVSILSYGFLITHTTIGMDDTCLDRYYGDFLGYNMIAAGRWGSYLLYKCLRINSFTPFWLETLTIVFFIFTAIIISCFIRKNIKSNDIVISTIFSCIYLSYSLINEALIFQPSNLALIISNLLTIITIVSVFEIMTDNNNIFKKRYYLILASVMAFAISLYEACCQTYLVCMFTCVIVILMNNKKINLLKFIMNNLSILIVGIILNYVILYIFYFIGIPNQLSGGRSIGWFTYGIVDGLAIFSGLFKEDTIDKMMYFPVFEFIICAIVGLILSIYFSIRKKNIIILDCYFIILFSNFALAFLQCKEILYRTETSWSIFVAIIISTTYYVLSNKKIIKYIAAAMMILIILWQTKDLNQWFYSEWIKYQRDVMDGYQVANDIKKNVNDFKKPIVFIGYPNRQFQIKGHVGAQSNGLSVIWWGYNAFDDDSYELIKFINSLGYHFNKPTDEQWYKGKELAEDMQIYPKDGYVKEFEDIIVVKFSEE